MVIEAIGYLGGLVFALSALPQAWHVWKVKQANGLAWSFLATWLVGELLMIAYAIGTRQGPLLLNYIPNLVCLLFILKYKVTPGGLNDKGN